MGGGNNQAQQQSTQLAQQQAQTGQQFVDLSKQQLAQGTALEQPLVNFYSSILSGQPGALNVATSQQTGNIARNTQQAEQSVMNNVPQGAGRDAALAQARIGQGQQTAQVQNQEVNNAYTGLAQLGAANMGVGLSEANTGLSGFGGAQQAYGNIQQAQAQQKSATMGAIGSIVGGVGSAFGGTQLWK